jgi:dCMP deaminase
MKDRCCTTATLTGGEEHWAHCPEHPDNKNLGPQIREAAQAVADHYGIPLTEHNDWQPKPAESVLSPGMLPEPLVMWLDEEDKRADERYRQTLDRLAAIDAIPGDLTFEVVQSSKNHGERLSWDEWALGIAEAVAKRADCARRQVGAVILDPEHRIIATGYNGYPSGMPGCASEGACPRGRQDYAAVPAGASYTATSSRCDALHAEENAVLHARQSLRGCWIYVTHEPCPNCTRYLAGSGLAGAVWRNPESGALAEVTWPHNRIMPKPR